MNNEDELIYSYEELQDLVIKYQNISNNLQQENKQLKEKSDVLEENNKLLIQQKSQMYEDLDIAYEKIDKAIDFLHNNTMIRHCKEHYELLEILGDKEKEIKK